MLKWILLSISFLRVVLLNAQEISDLIRMPVKLNHWEVNVGIDRFDFWTSVSFIRSISPRCFIEPSFSLAVVKTFFQQNVTPKIGLGAGIVYFGKQQKVNGATTSVQLIADAGISQTIALYGVQIQNDAQFFVGHQFIIGKKKSFVCKMRAGSGVRQFYNSNSTISPVYYNAALSLGYRW
jgi:hypothetical protein